MFRRMLPFVEYPYAVLRTRLPLIFLIIVLALANLSANQVLAAASDLDFTFEANGKVTTKFFPSFNCGHAVALQPDGKIVAIGEAFREPVDYDFVFARYTPDGSGSSKGRRDDESLRCL
jgi:hypothetical protein